MQPIEVIPRGFWVISSFHSAAEGLGPLARISEPSNGGSLDVHLELSFVLLHIRAKPHHILPALCNQDSTRPPARIFGAMAPPKRGVEPSGCDHRLPRAGTARLLCLSTVTLLDEMSRCCATVISDKLRSSGRYHITSKYLARNPRP